MSSGVRLCSVAAGAATWLVCETAIADPSAKPAHHVDFSADEVELDGDLEELRLSGDVDVRVHRYRVRSQALALRRTPRGIVVDGEGRVAFCPCPAPPVTIGFTSATVAPPSDLVLRHPTLRVGGVPVAWLPYLWLRSPDRLGLLPPRVEWRGEDGLLAGAGLHVPLGAGSGRTDVDVEAAGYFQGGADVITRVTSPGATAAVRWDHLGDDLLGVDLAATSRPRDGSSVSARADALRGPRARRGTVALEPASRAYDRAEVAASRAGAGGIVGVGVRTVAPRGGAVTDAGVPGPVAHASWGAALGDAGTTHLEVATRTLAGGAEATTLVEPRAEAEGTAHAGPVVARLRTATGGAVISRSRSDGRSLFGLSTLTVGVPLARDYGSWVHVLEPQVGAAVGAGVTHGIVPTWVGEPALRGVGTAAFAGVASAAGSHARREAVTAEVHGGAAGLGQEATPGASARARAATRPVGADLLAAVLGDGAGVLVGSTRWGAESGPNLRVHGEGRRADPDRAALLSPSDWGAARGPLLEGPGWSVGAEARMPWASTVASALGAEWDATAQRLLAVTGATGYRHPCACLSVLAWAGRRIGRDGFDARLTVDLLPSAGLERSADRAKLVIGRSRPAHQLRSAVRCPRTSDPARATRPCRRRRSPGRCSARRS